ncbi:1-deoxy-D-xylulose-5-phosphate reductoisomerase [Granulicoccus phenolivorans]|uniref:1-deoxy-D-xylulose-5-phosphate reductoisomerase n=1 Tax=Granulicoccus phenolivorans TaxID=266854 RepID=UPI0004232568|nr:1-deoxy-D-xylulose-5-phosphate reductoisomerase [Granulicoccus phenolivorans]
MRDIVILGSTGSIGSQTLDVIRERRDQFRVAALTAGGSNIPLLAEQILEFAPPLVALSRPTAVQDLQLALYAAAKQRGWATGEMTLPKIVAGPEANLEAARLPCDLVMNAITGAAGLTATLATLEAGTKLALANKESLVIGGRLVTDKAAPGQLIAVDSEHSAIAQCLRAGRTQEVRRVILTASGGPFRGRRREELTEVTPEQAMKHPTWNMGRVITINSATLVNKGLELLEAGLLYDIDLDLIEPVVHPQSIVHSMVEFHDGSTIAQCSPPDMRLPIALSLSWPDRLANASAPIDWTQAASWTFEPLDHEAFPAVDLARRAGQLGGTAPAVFNAANEACVDAFCAGTLSFLGIVDTIARVLDEHVANAENPEPAGGDVLSSRPRGAGLVGADRVTIDDVLAADAWARARAADICA